MSEREMATTVPSAAPAPDDAQRRAQEQWLRDGSVPADYLHALFDAATNTKPESAEVVPAAAFWATR